MERGGRGEVGRLLELMGAAGVAVVQPVLDVIGNSPETVIFRDVHGRDLLIFALLVAAAPAIGLWAIGFLARPFGPVVYRWVHTISLGALLGVAGLVTAELAFGWEGMAAIAAGALAAAVSVLTLTRWDRVRLVLLYLSPFPLVAVALFLFISPAGDLLDAEPGAEASDTADDTPVVMLVLDELPTLSLLDPRGGIDADRFPNFARLSREAVWFRNHSGASGFSSTAVPGLLTGRVPGPVSPTPANYPHSIFTMLGGSHRLRVGEALTQLCPPSLCEAASTLTRRNQDDRGVVPLLGDAAEVLGELAWPWADGTLDHAEFEEDVSVASLPPTAGGGEGPQTIGRPERFDAFVDGLVDSAEPTFHFLHLVLPHSPWSFLPDGRQYDAPAEAPGVELGHWGSGVEAPAVARQRHLLQTQYVDSLLGDLIDRLETTALWDEAVVVVTADHGISFTADQPTRALSDRNAHEVAWPPLFIRAPGTVPGPTDLGVEAIDVVPMLAGLLGAEVAWPVDGQDRLAGGQPSAGATTRQYLRIHNEFWQPEPTGVVTLDGPAVFDDLLGAAAEPLLLGDLVPDVVGRATSDLEIGSPSSATVRIQDLEDLRHPGEGLLPALVRGSVAEPVGEDDLVVFVLNGRVAGVSPVFPTLDEAQAVEALLDPDLIAGENEVEAYLTDASGEMLRQARVEAA